MDKVKKTPKPSITEAEEQQYAVDAEAAKKLLDAPEFKFFREFLVREKEIIIDNAVNNKLKKIVHKKEDHDVIYQKRDQELEDAGRFKFIFALINHLKIVVNHPKEIERAKEKGQLTVK